MKLFLLASLAAPALVAGQGIYGPQPGPASPASSSSAAAAIPTAGPGQHIIQVGAGNQLMFTPSSVTAAVNDTIIFVFPTGGAFNHSISQSTFQNPCTLMPGGFDSGLQPPGMQWSLVVQNASTPIWFFCQQTVPVQHCGSGMVGAINPPSTGNTIDAFISSASAIGTSEGPQTANPNLVGSGAFASASATPISASSIPASSGGNGAGRLVIGAGALLTGVVGLVFTLV